MALLLSFMMLILFMLMFIFSSSFFFCWILMECANLMFLVFICIHNMNQKFSMIAIYFLIQTLGSSIFLVSISLSFGLLFEFVSMFMFMFSITMKLGLFPFHWWVVNLIRGMNWFSIGLMSTTQKFMPMIFMINYFNFYYLLIVNILTMLISLYFVLGTSSVKLVFSYSIISHTSWLSMMLLNINLWFVYYLLYSGLFLVICFFNYYLSIEDFEDYSLFYFIPSYYSLFYFLNIISLSGMPPFSGFLIKYLMLDLFSYYFTYLFMFLLLLNSVIQLYMYMRLVMFILNFFVGKVKPLLSYFWFNFNFLNYTFMFSILFNLFILLIGFFMIN